MYSFQMLSPCQNTVHPCHQVYIQVAEYYFVVKSEKQLHVLQLSSKSQHINTTKLYTNTYKQKLIFIIFICIRSTDMHGSQSASCGHNSVTIYSTGSAQTCNVHDIIHGLRRCVALDRKFSHAMCTESPRQLYYYWTQYYELHLTADHKKKFTCKSYCTQNYLAIIDLNVHHR